MFHYCTNAQNVLYFSYVNSTAHLACQTIKIKIFIARYLVLFQKSAFSKYQKQGVQCLTSTKLWATPFGGKVA